MIAMRERIATVHLIARATLNALLMARHSDGSGLTGRCIGRTIHCAGSGGALLSGRLLWRCIPANNLPHLSIHRNPKITREASIHHPNGSILVGVDELRIIELHRQLSIVAGSGSVMSRFQARNVRRRKSKRLHGSLTRKLLRSLLVAASFGRRGSTATEEERKESESRHRIRRAFQFTGGVTAMSGCQPGRVAGVRCRRLVRYGVHLHGTKSANRYNALAQMARNSQ